MSDSKFQLERVQGAPVTDEEILTDIRHAATLAGTNVISQRLYSEFGKCDPTTAARRFGTWNKAVIAAGLEIANEINISDDRLFENLMLLWEHYGRQPRRAELARPFAGSVQTPIPLLDGCSEPIRIVCERTRRDTSKSDRRSHGSQNRPGPVSPPAVPRYEAR
jgi:hypothetical protein